jgi:hypothetical protein
MADVLNGGLAGTEALDEKTLSPEVSLINVPARGINIEHELAEIEKNIQLFNRIKVVALKLTKPSDWVNQGGSPYLMDRGAENVAIAFGVDISDVQLKLEWAEDIKGRYYTYVASGKAYSKKLARYVEDLGVCSQRDRFFGWDSHARAWRPIEDVDMANIRRKAVTNLYNRLIKRVIGLMNVTFDDLKQAGIDPERLGKVEYVAGRERAEAEITPEGKELRTKLGDMLMRMANNDTAAAAKLLEKYSTWTDDDKKERKASSLAKMSEKWIKTTYGRVKKDYEKLAPPQEREPGEEG